MINIELGHHKTKYRVQVNICCPICNRTVDHKIFCEHLKAHSEFNLKTTHTHFAIEKLRYKRKLSICLKTFSIGALANIDQYIVSFVKENSAEIEALRKQSIEDEKMLNNYKLKKQHLGSFFNMTSFEKDNFLSNVNTHLAKINSALKINSYDRILVASDFVAIMEKKQLSKSERELILQKVFNKSQYKQYCKIKKQGDAVESETLRKISKSKSSVFLIYHRNGG